MHASTCCITIVKSTIITIITQAVIWFILTTISTTTRIYSASNFIVTVGIFISFIITVSIHSVTYVRTRFWLTCSAGIKEIKVNAGYFSICLADSFATSTRSNEKIIVTLYANIFFTRGKSTRILRNWALGINITFFAWTLDTTKFLVRVITRNARDFASSPSISRDFISMFIYANNFCSVGDKHFLRARDIINLNRFKVFNT
mmetsp:Transcript_14140/g.17863  ORF Transcript_14140/g.17863 Transcript_14140/m.17863 type:complete len:203 (-) Transcript_14140:308-916(-)